MYWKKKLSILCGLMLFLLSACASTELERRCFPTIVLIGYENQKVSYALGFPEVPSSDDEDASINEIRVPMTEEADFEKSKTKYESNLNKIADYNHLKILVLEEEFIEQKVLFENMLTDLAQTEEYPRNTYVCIVDDIEDLLEMEEKLPQELGAYLEEYINNHKMIKDSVITLGDLIDEKENKKLILQIPYFDTEDKYVEWNGYYTWK